jgi:putative Mg2+ transporter-C (MgtC) family protein
VASGDDPSSRIRIRRRLPVSSVFLALLGGPWLDSVWDLLYLDLLIRLVTAAILGGAIGFEREMRGKPAGLRTNILICVGAALFTELSVTVAGSLGGVGGPAEPSRISAQIVSGIGFLGAGTIIQARGTVSGLTSAATLWVVGAIGMAAGSGAFLAAVGGTVLVFLVLLPLGWVEFRVSRRRLRRVVVIRLREAAGLMERIQSLLEVAGLRGQVTEMERDPDGDELRVRMVIRGKESLFQRACHHLLTLPEVHSVAMEARD